MNAPTLESSKLGYRVELLPCNGLANPRRSEILESRRPTVIDTIDAQVAELIKMQEPSRPWSDEDSLIAARQQLGDNPELYGTWVYYSWRNTLVHLLSEAEFVQVRTNRNQHKITASEQQTLRSKRLGIIGLSVGSGIALTMAMERTVGVLRIADFDDLELSNLNRLRSSVCNLGLPKAVIAAREIAEIDPYLKVEVFSSGVNADNIDAFLGGDRQPLDLLVEECDSLAIKILARVKARERGIPVIMETSDRGMVDIERFDLQPDLGILHGRLSDEECQTVIDSGTWTPEMAARIMSPAETSERMKLSISELGKSIGRWPQLASEVSSGAGVVTHLSRKILLGDKVLKGRKFLDPYELFLD